MKRTFADDRVNFLIFSGRMIDRKRVLASPVWTEKTALSATLLSQHGALTAHSSFQ
jgi:hypothetical protein